MHVSKDYEVTAWALLNNFMKWPPGRSLHGGGPAIKKHEKKAYQQEIMLRSPTAIINVVDDWVCAKVEAEAII